MPKSNEQERQARRVQQQAERNARRSRKYYTDAEHRQARLEASRRAYREQHGVELQTCLDRLESLADYGVVRDVEGIGPILSFTLAEFAEIVGPYKAQVVYRWKSKGLIPPPLARARVVLETTGKAGTYETWQDVYVEEEVRAMMEVIGTHQCEVRYYRQTDTETIRAVFEAVNEVRGA